MMTSVTEQRSIKSAMLDLDPQDDELEQMLAQAERLANEMRSISSKNNSGASYSRGFPETIQIKDKDSACSSMEVTNIFDLPQVQESESFSSNHGNNVQEDVIDEENEVFSADGPDVEINANISASSHDLSDLSSTRRTFDDVDAIVQASQEMARTLEAIQVSSPDSSQRVAAMIEDIPENHTADSSPRSLTPSPASPESVCGDSKTTAPISHVTNNKEVSSSTGIDVYHAKAKLEGGDVTWEKIDYTRELDEDYVPIADYSKKSTPPRKTVDKNGINWEKLASPNRFDKDFTPLRDYSTVASPKRKDEYSFAPDPLPTFGNQRRSTLRRLRKRQKRVRMAIFLLVLTGITAIGWWQRETVGDVMYQVRLAALGPSPKEFAAAEQLAAKAAAVDAARHAKEKKAAVEAAAARAAEEAERIAQEKKIKEEDARNNHAAATAAATAKAAMEKAATEKTAMEKANAVEEFKGLCDNVWVFFISPVCREKKSNLFKQFGVTNPLAL